MEEEQRKMIIKNNLESGVPLTILLSKCCIKSFKTGGGGVTVFLLIRCVIRNYIFGAPAAARRVL